ncbi:MAG: O-antigen ligase family protein, partial [Akkermansiaceae bacterium]
SASATRNLALTFVLAVAAYALVSKLLETQIDLNHGKLKFGFFPNRNHTSNLLSAGFLCGLGIVFQSVRNKNFYRLAASLIAAGVILWAVLSWNLSRSGIALCLAGPLLWLVLLGRRYFGKQEIKVLGLVVLLAGGVYGLSEFRVKDRVDKTIEKVEKISWEDEDAASAVKLTDLDLRVPIAIDTAGMIADAPLSGVGAGQFRWVFPQYREQTIVVNRPVAVHPESSWLWLAAELGIPAAACVLGLVVFLFVRGVKNIKKANHRDRALRIGCLVAAALVPLHGIFDVPAHRPALFLAALLLYALSQNPVARESEPTKFSRWSSLALALLLIAVGVRLLGASWFGWTPSHIVKSQERLAEGVAIYGRVSDLNNLPSPFESLELRKQIDRLAERSTPDAPLDGRLYRLSALALLPLNFEREKTARNFGIDRALTPYSVSIPLLHASAALFYNPDEVGKGWSAAVERAKAVDQIQDEGPVATKRALRVIAKSVARSPQLKELAEEIGEKAK